MEEKDQSKHVEEAQSGHPAPTFHNEEGDDKMSFQSWMAAIVRRLLPATTTTAATRLSD